MTPLERYAAAAREAGCPRDQIERFVRAGVVLQPRQLAASAAARLCDRADGPTAVGYGGARGGGKSHWLLAQMGADDCQRVPGLKCLLLRKVGKANMENFEDLRRRLFGGLAHDFSAYRGVLKFANGSRIIAGHFQSESDIDAYLGLEYDVIGIEEATTLSSRKHQDISTCSRTSKPNWRPRIYSTTNPGGVGHAWYRARFIIPFQDGKEAETRFIPARVGDNRFNNPEYTKILANLTGWQKRAWFDGDWDIAAGQFFTTFRREVHVVGDMDVSGAGVSPQFLPPTIPQKHAGLTPRAVTGGSPQFLPPTIPQKRVGLTPLAVFDDTRAREWFAALDYGFTHYTVALLGCTDGDGNVFVVDEHAERLWLPQRHAQAIRAMLGRHVVPNSQWPIANRQGGKEYRKLEISDLKRFVAGADVFSKQSDGSTVAAQYAKLGITLRQANMDRVNGWAEILQRL
ncbi:MAG: hypothetical protein AAB676_02425, partial [Verrucomicrobiota bacterium]